MQTDNVADNTLADNNTTDENSAIDNISTDNNSTDNTTTDNKTTNNNSTDTYFTDENVIELERDETESNKKVVDEIEESAEEADNDGDQFTDIPDSGTPTSSPAGSETPSPTAAPEPHINDTGHISAKSEVRHKCSH